MGFAVPPTYAGYPMAGASVVPVGPSVPAPVMMVPAYGVSPYAPVAVYNSPTPVATTATPSVAATQQPKPLSQEVRILISLDLWCPSNYFCIL
jgi:hypothetical protein